MRVVHSSFVICNLLNLDFGNRERVTGILAVFGDRQTRACRGVVEAADDAIMAWRCIGGEGHGYVIVDRVAGSPEMSGIKATERRLILLDKQRPIGSDDMQKDGVIAGRSRQCLPGKVHGD